MARKRVFSGIQPTGIPHIGNYFGAIRNYVAMQDEYDAIYCVVDYHAMTVNYDTSKLMELRFDVARALLACGLDQARCTLFIQSDVPAHTELTWIFSTIASMGRLQNMTQFKDKAEHHEENINAGLFTYPILMAADILIYKGEKVPVGDDQLQHLELSREIARRFNSRFGEGTFPEPEPILSQTPRIMGIDGPVKMSKSLGNTIDIFDSAEEVWAKLRRAYTDPARKRRTDPGNPDICNIFTIHKQVSPPELVAYIDQACRKAEISCFECKQLLNTNLNAVLEPIRERGKELAQHPDMVYDVLNEGKMRCRELAAETMHEVRVKTGLEPA